jgi:hypothetical protein
MRYWRSSVARVFGSVKWRKIGPGYDRPDAAKLLAGRSRQRSFHLLVGTCSNWLIGASVQERDFSTTVVIGQVGGHQIEVEVDQGTVVGEAGSRRVWSAANS